MIGTRDGTSHFSGSDPPVFSAPFFFDRFPSSPSNRDMGGRFFLSRQSVSSYRRNPVGYSHATEWSVNSIRHARNRCLYFSNVSHASSNVTGSAYSKSFPAMKLGPTLNPACTTDLPVFRFRIRSGIKSKRDCSNRFFSASSTIPTSPV